MSGEQRALQLGVLCQVSIGVWHSEGSQGYRSSHLCEQGLLGNGLHIPMLLCATVG